MKPQKAIDAMNDIINSDPETMRRIPRHWKLAANEAIKALRKAEPKAPVYEESARYDIERQSDIIAEVWTCGTCGSFIDYYYGNEKDNPPVEYCPSCGQAIDWSEARKEDE